MRKEIVYDRETRDFAMYLNGDLVGFARSYHEAETTLDQLVYEVLSRGTVDLVEQHRETLAEDVDAAEPETVTPIEAAILSRDLDRLTAVLKSRKRCANCGSAHHIQACPEVIARLMEVA